MSAFYKAGYTAAYNGEPCEPPDPWTSPDGTLNEWKERNYCAGYNDAMRAWDDSNPIPIYTAGADF